MSLKGSRSEPTIPSFCSRNCSRNLTLSIARYYCGLRQSPLIILVLGRLILNYYPRKNVISPFDSPTMTPSRAAILRLINASQHSSCPCHGSHTSHNAHMVYNQLRRLATPVEKVDKEYAFEVWHLFCLLAGVTVNVRRRLPHPIFGLEMASLVRSVWT